MILPLVTVRYLGLQEGFGPIAPRALFNVVGGPVEMIGSTVTLESLTRAGYAVREKKLSLLSGDPMRAAGSVEVNGPTDGLEPLTSAFPSRSPGAMPAAGNFARESNHD